MYRIHIRSLVILLFVFSFTALNTDHSVGARTDATSNDVPQTAPMPGLSGEEAASYLREQGLYPSLEEALEAARYTIHEAVRHPLGKETGVLAADNPRHAFRVYFNGSGTHLRPKDARADWKLDIGLEKLTRGPAALELNRKKPRARENASRLEIDYTDAAGRMAGLTEWFENAPAGLEQGWTLARRPEGKADANLKLHLRVAGDLVPRAAPDGRSVTFRTSEKAAVLSYDRLKSWDARGRQLRTFLEADETEVRIVVDDAAAVYPVTIDPFYTQTRKLTASDGAAVDNFGQSVAVSGDTAIVGAYRDDDGASQTGSVYIFRRNTNGGDQWGEFKKITASDGVELARFGWSVSIDGDTAVVGAYRDPGNATGSGAAYIIERNRGGIDNWGEVKKLTPSDGAADDGFGYSVSISGNTVIVGSVFDDDGGNDSGSAYVYERNQGGADNWGEVKKITASDPAGNERFGEMVSLSGDTAVVGARNDTPLMGGGAAGAAHVFARNQGGADNWGEVKKLTAANPSNHRGFGFSVAIGGDTVLVGTPNNPSPAVFVFERNQGGADNWGQVRQLLSSDFADEDEFGYAVAVSGDRALVGARLDDDGGASSGSAYVFARNQGGADNWGEVQKIIAADGEPGDQYGWSVAIDGDTVLVGAHSDDIGGMNTVGSAYIYSDLFDNYTEIDKQVAPDGFNGFNFGNSVSISGDTAVVGATGDNDNGTSSGSAYVFERNTDGADAWGLKKKLLASDGGALDVFGTSVAISGDTIIVGAQQQGGTNPGAAYLFRKNQGGAGNWGEIKKLTASDGVANDRFGFSVAIDDDTAVVGAVLGDGAQADSGAVYVFEKNQGGPDNWGEVKKLSASDGTTGAQFARAVAIFIDRVLVGAINDSSGTGAAYVYGRNQGGADNWGEVRKLTASDGAASDFFGGAVGLSSGFAVVGAEGDESDTGAAYVFARNQGGADNWGEVKKLTASDAAAGDRFGTAVGIDRGKIVAGAFFNGPGALYVFHRNRGGADNWGEVKKLTASDGVDGDRLGRSVSVSGDTIITGAPEDDMNTLLPGGSLPTRKGKTSFKFGGGENRTGSSYVFSALAPATTATASVSGRVVSGQGAGVPRIIVSLTEADGTVHYARTNMFGRYRFSGIGIYQSVSLEGAYKMRQVEPRTVSVSGDLSGVNLMLAQ